MNTSPRTNEWLTERLYSIWEDYFADIPRKNYVIITFGRASSRQLGSIKWATKKTRIKSIIRDKDVQEEIKSQDDKRITVITITRKFQNQNIPEYVVDATIAHELVHYTHGFSSPLKQAYKHPHQGGLIRKELQARGLGSTHKRAKRWIREHWPQYA